MRGLARSSLVIACMAFVASASAQDPRASGRAGGGARTAPPPGLQISLVRQDFSDCTNSDVNTNDPSRIGGTVWVNRNANGHTDLVVAISAKPNTTYHFFLKCVRLLGDITTYDEGEGKAMFSFPTNSVGNVYAFDMYPEGAPAGNKYQSVQVKF
jgi:hypothetical protein